METFINETMMSDISICDELIEYHSRNIEHKTRGITAGGEGSGKVSTDVGLSPGIQNPIVQLYKSEVINAV